MTSSDRYILGVTLFLMLTISSADIHCKMKSGCSTQCDPIEWNNIEEHLFNKEFSITCRNNEDDKLREEFEDLKTENRIVKNLLLTVQENHNKEIEELKTNHKNLQKKISEMEIENEGLKSSLTKMQEKYDEDITNINTTISGLNKQPTPLLPTGCHEIKLENSKEKSGTGGVFDIYYLNSKIEVVCDLTTDGGKWTVFQRRFDGSQDFSKDWKKYVEGFGSLTGEFWLGLEKIHLLTQTGQYELRIEMTDENGKVGIAKYQTFSISGSSDNYRLNIGEFSGNGVSNALRQHNNMDFTTKNRDNDKMSDGNCAIQYGGGGGWWYNNCFWSLLNSPYSKITWVSFNRNIRKTEMKFRKK